MIRSTARRDSDEKALALADATRTSNKSQLAGGIKSLHLKMRKLKQELL